MISLKSLCLFLSTHPCGVRPVVLISRMITKKFLSTHPCGVRQSYRCPAYNQTRISIHAPLRGATVGSVKSIVLHDIFLSTHPCGVRLGYFRQVSRDKRFLSTHPCGVRLCFLTLHSLLIIHFYPRTPAGCDGSLANSARTLEDFYPRTPAGCDTFTNSIVS